MFRVLTLWVCLLLFASGPVLAQDEAADKGAKDKDKAQAQASDAKELSGMSIVGNDEAPKSLYIVPWKSSEIGAETSMHMMLNDKDGPVDRDVFMRQLDFYNVSVGR